MMFMLITVGLTTAFSVFLYWLGGGGLVRNPMLAATVGIGGWSGLVLRTLAAIALD